MPKFAAMTLFFLTMSLFVSPSRAETYFLKIEQDSIKSKKSFLQTCSIETSPCTFYMPIKFEKGGAKDISIVMRIDEQTQVFLQFYWDKLLLRTNHFGEEYYKLWASKQGEEIKTHTIILRPNFPPEKPPSQNAPVLKFSEAVVATLKAQAIRIEEFEKPKEFFFNN